MVICCLLPQPGQRPRPISAARLNLVVSRLTALPEPSHAAFLKQRFLERAILDRLHIAILFHLAVHENEPTMTPNTQFRIVISAFMIILLVGLLVWQEQRYRLVGECQARGGQWDGASSRCRPVPRIF